MKLIKIAAILAIFSGSAFAATDGPLSINQSNANLDVSATVEPVISITHVDDVSFGVFTPGIDTFGGEDVVLTESMCIYTNAAGFELELRSNFGVGTGFAMGGEIDRDILPYSIAIEHGTEGDGFEYVPVTLDALSGISYPFLSYASGYYTDTDCNSSTTLQENIVLRFRLLGDDILDALPDDYTDTITITARTSSGTIPQ